MSALNSALAGIQSATASFDASAAKIATSRSAVDLATAVTTTVTDKTAIKADVKVAQTANNMQQRLLDTFA